MPWTQRSRLRATSAMDSRAPSEAEAWVWSRKTTEPPMLWMPTSKVTRVRRDGFSKMSAMNLPVSEEAYRPGLALISAESWSRSCVCEGLHSAPVSKSFDKEIGVTSADVVIISPCRGEGSLRRRRGFRGLWGGGLLRSSYKEMFE